MQTEEVVACTCSATFPDVPPLGPAVGTPGEPCCRHEAKWPRSRVLTSGVIPSTLFKYLVTSLVHSLNPAMYLLNTDGSLATATAVEDRYESNSTCNGAASSAGFD